ncbi:MAG: DUF1702 family protein [candidate division Zixibacteria bacterium]
MGRLLGTIRHGLMGLSEREALFSQRGFPGKASDSRSYLEEVGRTFIYGYNSSLRDPSPDSLESSLSDIDNELRGFAYEGSAMGLTILDLLTPFKHSRLRSFLNGPASAHTYMIHVGAGWALARLRRSLAPFLQKMDPLLGWLVVDGYGFHQGYFHWEKYLKRGEYPAKLSDNEMSVFDRGLGRALWFVHGADIRAVVGAIDNFRVHRRASLWSGVGLACSYAGKVSRNDLKSLLESSGEYQPLLSQGAAFAAKARELANNMAEHTQLACEELCQMSANDAAALTDELLPEAKGDDAQNAFDLWCQRLQTKLTHEISAEQQSVTGTNR